MKKFIVEHSMAHRLWVNLLVAPDLVKTVRSDHSKNSTAAAKNSTSHW